VLTFKALQTYSNGEVVRWIGSPSSSEPAPTVTVTAATAGASAAPSAPPPAAADADDGSADTLAIVALIVGALGLLVGIAGFVTRRRSTAAA
jgi:uncharacterized protein HemX